MWLRHWGLRRDPFAGDDALYVPLPSHDEALARLVYAIEAGWRSVAFVAEAGLGKTTVIRQALRETRGPRRRPVLIRTPGDGRRLLAMLAEALGRPAAAVGDGDEPWSFASRAVRAARLERTHLVLVLDDWDDADNPRAARDLSALLETGTAVGPPATLIRVGRHPMAGRTEVGEAGELSIGLERLARSDVATYVEARIEAAGCRERLFTPRSLTRLHGWCGGIPRTLDRLAMLSLMAGAAQGLEVVSPEVVDGVAGAGPSGVNLAVVSR